MTQNVGTDQISIHWSAIQIDHKCLKDSVKLSPGLNLVIGRNNSGKSTLLRAISSLGGPKKTPDVPKKVEISVGGLKQFLANGLALPERNLNEAKKKITSQFYPITMEVEQLSNRLGIRSQHSSLSVVSSNGEIVQGKQPKWNLHPQDIFRNLRERTVLIEGVRTPPSCSRADTVGKLKGDCSNLPNAIAALGDDQRRKDFNSVINLVFPEIKDVFVLDGIETEHVNRGTPQETAIVHVVWDVNVRFSYGTFQLAEVGSGVAQIAALAVALTDVNSACIVIDEPSSFLHPDATRRFMDVLAQFGSDKQIIISTHSPIVISRFPSRVISLSKGDDEPTTSVEYVEDPIGEIRRMYEVVGARLSDIFGLDRILWVEGPTEERCLPHILKAFTIDVPIDCVVRPVRETEPFSKKHKIQAVVELYNQVSTCSGLFPIAVGYVFDREALKLSDVRDLQKLASGRVRFIPQMMFENYLLVPQAVAAWLKEQGNNVRPPDVEKELTKILESEKPNATWSNMTTLKKIHGANVLKQLIKVFDSKLTYNKPKDGEWIVKWLIENGEVARFKTLVKVYRELFEEDF